MKSYIIIGLLETQVNRARRKQTRGDFSEVLSLHL